MKIKLLEQHGNAEAGLVYVQGLHGVPEHKDWQGSKPEEFYWREGSNKEDANFIYHKWLGKHQIL